MLLDTFHISASCSEGSRTYNLWFWSDRWIPSNLWMLPVFQIWIEVSMNSWNLYTWTIISTAEYWLLFTFVYLYFCTFMWNVGSLAQPFIVMTRSDHDLTRPKFSPCVSERWDTKWPYCIYSPSLSILNIM